VDPIPQDQQSRELSQGHTSKRAKRLKLKEAEVKLPRLLQMDAGEVRHVPYQ
jgi:U3 small nucleolar RNA-associated protein 21